MSELARIFPRLAVGVGPLQLRLVSVSDDAATDTATVTVVTASDGNPQAFAEARPMSTDVVNASPITIALGLMPSSPYHKTLFCRCHAQYAKLLSGMCSGLCSAICLRTMQRLALPLGVFLQTSLAAAGLPCIIAMQSLTAVAGETLMDQVLKHVHSAPGLKTPRLHCIGCVV